MEGVSELRGCEVVLWGGCDVAGERGEGRGGGGGARGVVVDLRYPNGMYFVSGI